MINYFGRYAAPKLHFFASCHFISCSRAQPENIMSLEAEVNSSKWLSVSASSDIFSSCALEQEIKWQDAKKCNFGAAYNLSFSIILRN